MSTEFVIPKNLFSDRIKIEQEYLAWIAKNPSIKDCVRTLISFLEMSGYLNDIRVVGSPESNRRYINGLSNRELAELLINISTVPDYDYDYDEKLVECGTIDICTASDGTIFQDYEDAVDYEIRWLDQPHFDNTDEKE